jgi:hypothetical protein
MAYFQKAWTFEFWTIRLLRKMDNIESHHFVWTVLCLLITGPEFEMAIQIPNQLDKLSGI